MKSAVLNKQVLFLTLGYPGAGKSYVARQLAEEMDLIRISADRIRYELFENPTFSRDEDDIVFRILDYMLEEALKSGKSIVCDGDFGLRKSRRVKYELARKHSAHVIILWVQTDLETAFQRASSRDGRKLDDKYSFNHDRETFEKLVGKLKRPQGEPTIVISGKHIFKVQYTNILRKLQQANLIGEPVRSSSPIAESSNSLTRKPLLSRRRARNARSLRINE